MFVKLEFNCTGTWVSTVANKIQIADRIQIYKKNDATDGTRDMYMYGFIYMYTA